MTSKKDQVTYLLGAGASANALPIVKYDMINKIERFNENDVKKKLINEVYEEFSKIIKNIKNSPFSEKNPNTIDNYARELSLKKDTGNDKSELEYKYLKYMLSCFFINEQKKEKVNRLDFRYPNFLNSILKVNNTNLEIKDHINIISWNYDLQLELSYSRLIDTVDESERNYTSQKNLKIIPRPEFNYNQVHTNFDEFKVIKLNGSCAHMLDVEKEHITVTNNLLINETTLMDEIRNTRDCIHGSNNLLPLISFAWEKSNLNTLLINSAKYIISKTDILVVIGYSFPNFNLEIDSVILNNFSNEIGSKKIYLQYPTEDEFNLIKKTINRILKPPILDDNFEFIKAVNNEGESEYFCIPIEAL